MFNYLDANVGKNQYTVFLTADHAAVDVPAYLQTVKIPAGYIDSKAQKNKFIEFVEAEFGTADLIENVSNNQVFLNRAKLKELDLDLDDVQNAIVNEIINYEHIDKAYTATTMSSTEFNSGIEALLQRGFNQKKSGDVIFVYAPAFISYSKINTRNYDTHVPLLFFGKGIKHGDTFQKTEITDIAPTMSALLGISFPNGAIGQPLEFVLE